MSDIPQEISQVPDMLIRLSIPKTVSLEQATEFAQGLMRQIEEWHRLCEPEAESVDLTKPQ